MNIGGLDTHPAADVFPMMDDARLAELVADVESNGLIRPIVLLDGQILDGRNRMQACVETATEPRFEEWTGNDPYQWVWSMNAARRDLTHPQRYACWQIKEEGSAAWQATAAAIRESGNARRAAAARDDDSSRTSSPTTGNVTRPAKAAAAHVDAGTVARMDRLRATRPDLWERVHLGMKLSQAMRIMRRDEVVSRSAALPTGKYRVFYADPPWAYSSSGAISETDHYSRVERHYPAMPLADICAMPVAELAADDAVLFLWATSPMLEAGLAVVRAWGFKYKACFVWDKVRHNWGNYNSVRHEFLLVGTRGSGLPESPTLYDSVVSVERTSRHSEKPAEFRRIIDDLYPTGRRIEFFARQSADGWESWGNEAAG